MNKLLDYFTENKLLDLNLDDIIKEWMKDEFSFLIINDKINKIISNKQKEDFTYLFLDPYRIIQYFQAEKNGELYDLRLIEKNIIRRKKDKVIKLQIDLEDDLTSYSYNFKCLSCGNIIKGKQLKDVYHKLRENSLLCNRCIKSVVHKTSDYRQKYESTMMKKYGAAYPVQNKIIRKKVEDTTLKRYGCKTPFHNGILRDKHYDTMMDRFGKRAISGFGGNKKNSIIELDFIETFLRKYYRKYNNMDNIFSDVNYKQWFVDTEIGRKWLDLYIKDIGMAIQIHGIFWHGHPDFFSKNEIHPVKGITFGELFEQSNASDKHIFNSDRINSYIVVWDYKIKENKNMMIDKIFDLIEEKFNGFITL